MEIFIKENQEVKKLPARVVRYVVEKGVKLHLNLEQVEGEVIVELRGDGSEVESRIYLAARDGKPKFNLEHRHVGRDTKSNMIQKMALLGKSHGCLGGTVRMDSGCSGAEGDLMQHSLLLSPEARVDAEPNLEISHHEVKASHASKMERVDDEALFYLTSRGLSRTEARQLLIEGFFAGASENLLKILL
jgi:Fe-S cluster assembly protein SufD